jgi:hypothetical protein
MITVGVYWNENNEFLIIPCAKNSEGWVTEINEPERLQWDGLSVVTLGEKILRAMDVSEHGIGSPSNQKPPVFALVTGAKSYRAFVKTHQMVNIFNYDQDGHDRLFIEFWHRLATYYGYDSRTDDPAEWKVELPLNPAPEAIGSAVLQVFRAGGVAISDLISSSSSFDPEMHEDRVSYMEFKTGLSSSFRLKQHQAETTINAIMALLEDVGQTVNEDGRLFVCAVITCSLICLEQGFLPDFLDEPVRQLGDISGQLTAEELPVYQADVAALKQYLAANPKSVEAPCPPDYFPGTWQESPLNDAWWNDLLHGIGHPIGE